MLSLRAILCIATLILPAVLSAQADSSRRPATSAPTVGPPVRRISTAAAVSTEDIGGINSVLELKDGRVLVNDGTRRRLLLMDTTLKTVEVVLDSLAEVANTYGTRAGMLIPYRGDSLLFVDPASYAALILDPSAHIARVRSAWRPDDPSPGADRGARWTQRVGRGRAGAGLADLHHLQEWNMDFVRRSSAGARIFKPRSPRSVRARS